MGPEIGRKYWAGEDYVFDELTSDIFLERIGWARK